MDLFFWQHQFLVDYICAPSISFSTRHWAIKTSDQKSIPRPGNTTFRICFPIKLNLS